MARTNSQDDQTSFIPPPAPAFTLSFHDWAETKLSYPREVYKGDYYRLTGGQEDHFKLLRAGWVDDRPMDSEYKPWTASPESHALAQRGLADLRAKAAAEAAKQIPTVSKDYVAEMIEKAFQEKMGG